jgi:hypothetical protein
MEMRQVQDGSKLKKQNISLRQGPKPIPND